MTTQGVWRDPAEETNEYPGLWVHDRRVTGSITAGQSRLPLWAISGTALYRGWDAVAQGWPDTHGLTQDDFASFMYLLLQARGEFGRLLLVLAEAERIELDHDPSWWDDADARQPVVDQLRRCLAALGAPT